MLDNLKDVAETLRNRFAESPLGRQLEGVDLDNIDNTNDSSLGAYADLDDSNAVASEYGEAGTREMKEDEKQELKDKLGWADEKLKKCTIDENGVIHYRTDRSDLEGQTSENGVPYERRRIEINNVVIEGVFPKFESAFDTELAPDNLKTKIGTRDVDYFDYANIRGRAGRLMEHCVGRVINLKKPPQAKEMSVDIPAYTQNPIDDEVLVNIEKAEVKPFNMERYQRFENLPEELKIILKRNAVSIKDQLELLPIIRAMLIDPHRRGDIVWSELRDRNLYNHLCIIFDLVKDRFVEGNDKNVLISTKWMATQTVSYIYNKNIRQMIVERVAYRAKEYLKKNAPNSADMHFSSQQFMVEYPEMARQFADEAVETIFKFQKNWLQYKIPKWLNVVDSLQKYLS